MATTQTETTTRRARYAAFLSYAHADKRACGKLHKSLERYRIPKRLRKDHGLPKRIGRIFRDKEELPAGGALPDRLTEALEASDHLIVLCSPRAAASEWVNKEVALFKQMGKGDRIIPVIAEGEAVDAFPATLTHEVGADLNPTPARDPAERLGADLQPEADGPKEGALKVVAGLLGLGFGEVKRRDLEAARARARRNGAIAAAFALMFIGTAGALYWALDNNARLQAAFVSVIENVAGRMDDVTARLDAGKLTSEQAESELGFARTLIESAFALAPDNPRLLEEEARMQLVFSRHYRTIGKTPEAQRAAARAEALYARLGGRGGDETLRLRSVALNEQGDNRLRGGDVAGALSAYEEGLEIARDLVVRDGGNLQYRRDVSVSLDRIGDIRLRGGDVVGALSAYEEGLEIQRGLVARDGGNLGYRRDVSVSLDKIGDIRLRGGDVAGALLAYEEGLEIARDLVVRDGGNLEYRRDVSVSLDRIGDIRLRGGDVAGALLAYEEGLEIRRDLVVRDGGNLGYRRDVSVSLDRIGDIRLRGGDVAGALLAYEEGLEIRRDLVVRDGGNLGYRRDVSVSLDKIGDIRLRGGDVAGALLAYEEGLEIRRDLVVRDGANVQFKRDLGVSLWRMARLDLVSWVEVAEHWEAMAEAGLLGVDDQAYVSEARRLADAEQ